MITSNRSKISRIFNIGYFTHSTIKFIKPQFSSKGFEKPYSADYEV